MHTFSFTMAHTQKKKLQTKKKLMYFCSIHEKTCATTWMQMGIMNKLFAE